MVLGPALNVLTFSLCSASRMETLTSQRVSIPDGKKLTSQRAASPYRQMVTGTLVGRSYCPHLSEGDMGGV